MLRVTSKFLYSNLHTFATLEQLNSHLLNNKYAHLLVYFRAAWNPQCQISDQHVNRLAAEHRFLEIVKVDSDISPKIANHYGARSEPQFVFCLYGDEVLRQIGPNYESLKQKLDRMVKLGAQTESQFLGPNERWSPYGTRFEKYYMEVLTPLYKRNVSDF